VEIRHGVANSGKQEHYIIHGNIVKKTDFSVAKEFRVKKGQKLEIERKMCRNLLSVCIAWWDSDTSEYILHSV
jgi:hypothetical protein